MRTSGDRRRFWLGVAITVLVTALAFSALGKVLSEVSYDQVAASLSRIGWLRIAAATVLTALCYVALSGYDAIALRSIGHPLAWRRSLCGSVSAYALSHNLGFAPVTATFARNVVYRHDGVGLGDAARIVVLTGTAFWLGVILMLGICLTAVPHAIETGMSDVAERGAGLCTIAVVCAYLLLIRCGWRKAGIGRWSVPLPSLPDAIRQMGISLVEASLATAVLWVLLPQAGIEAYPAVLLAYVTAFVAVLIAHTPGGAGVLETVVILMLPGMARADVISALILFRIIFHLLPLAVAATILCGHRHAPSPPIT